MKNSAFPGKSRKLFLLCFFAYSAIYIGRKNFSACMPGMIAAGAIDKVLGGTTGTAFLAVYACGQLVNGLLGDRLNPKNMITVGILGAAAANAAMGLNSARTMFPVIWGINGYFCSMIWAPVIRLMSERMTDEERQSSGAAISAAIPAGSVLSYLVCAFVLGVADWRAAFLACSAILAASAAFFFVRMTALLGKDGVGGKIEEGRAKAANELEAAPLPERLERLKKAPLPLLVVLTGLCFAVGAILFNGILKDGLDLWVPSYISEYFGLDDAVAAGMSTVLPVVNIIGIYIARFINVRYIKNEFGTCALLFGVSALSFVPLVTISAVGARGAGFAVLAVLLVSLTSASMLGINSMLLTFIPFKFARIGRASSVTGFLNSCSYVAASLSGVTIGVISSSYGWTAAVLAFLAVSLLGGAISAAGIKVWRRNAELLSEE